MSIGRTARGTQYGTDWVGGTVGSAFTPAAGSTIVLAIAYDNSMGDPTGATWGSDAMTRIDDGNAYGLAIYARSNVAAASHQAGVDCSDAGTLPTYAAVIVEVTGAATAAFDKAVGAAGTSTSPNSGNTATTAQANELLLGFVGRWDVAVNGTWGGSFTNGQAEDSRAGSSPRSYISEGYRSVTSTGAYSAGKTGASNGIWSAAIVTFKEASALPQTSTPASVSMSTAIGAAAVVAGAVLSSCSSVEMPLAPSTVTASIGDRAPSTLTQLATMQDGANYPAVLRSTVSTLKDQRLDTYASRPTPATWPATGTLEVDAAGFATTSIEGRGGISGVKFHAYARILKDATVTLSNGRFVVGGLADVALTGTAPTGTFASPPDFGHVETAVRTTDGNGDPWTWATLFAGLVSTRFRLDYSQPTPGDLAQLEVAEVWVEVWGPVGDPDVMTIGRTLKPGVVSLPIREVVGDAISIGPLVMPRVITKGVRP